MVFGTWVVHYDQIYAIVRKFLYPNLHLGATICKEDLSNGKLSLVVVNDWLSHGWKE
jgi:hypothetical protein